MTLQVDVPEEHWGFRIWDLRFRICLMLNKCRLSDNQISDVFVDFIAPTDYTGEIGGFERTFPE